MGEYLSESFYVSNVSSKQYRVIKELGKPAGVGYIVSDGGAINVQISRFDGGTRSEMKVGLEKNEWLEFVREQGWRIGDILISTDSTTAISGRLFLK